MSSIIHYICKSKTIKRKKNWQLFSRSELTSKRDSMFSFEFRKLSRKSIDFVHPIHMKKMNFVRVIPHWNEQCPSTNVIISMCVLSFFVINIQIDKFYFPCFVFFSVWLNRIYAQCVVIRFGLAQRISCSVLSLNRSAMLKSLLFCLCLIHTKNKIFCLIPHKYRNAF